MTDRYLYNKDNSNEENNGNRKSSEGNCWPFD